MLTDISVTVTPAVTVLQDTSRFLLTIGVGLFVAYLVLIIGANMVGFFHRQVATAVRRDRDRALHRPQTNPSQPANVARQTRVLESEVL